MDDPIPLQAIVESACGNFDPSLIRAYYYLIY